MSGGFDRGFTTSPLAGGGGAGVPLNFAQTKGAQVTITAAQAKPATVVSTTITTQGNPVQIIVTGDANPSAGGWGRLNIYRDGTAVGQLIQFESSAANENVPYCLQVVDEPAAGTWTYSLKVTTVTTDTQFGEGAGPIITVTELGAEAGGGGGGGITQLSGDVSAGPGTGLQSATVTRLQGNDISSATPSDGQILTWNGTAWVPGAPAAGGSGGGGQVYFLNFGTAASLPTTNLPGTPKELGLVGEIASTSVTSPNLPTNGTYLRVAGFVTTASAPNLDTIPAGVWDFNIWAQTNVSQENTTIFRVKVYKYDGSNAPSLIATGSPTYIYNPTLTIQYVSSVIIPQTSILTTDRIYVEIEARATSANHTITVSFGDSTPTHVHTTLPSIAGSGIVHVINGVIQSPASPVDLTAGGTEISGILPIANGGTSTSSTPANGQLLIGNGVDYTLANITQGSNITITNGAGSITIDAVGSIAGSIAANEVAFGTGGDAISGSPQLEWNPGTNTLTVADPAALPVLQVDTTSQLNGKVTVTGGTTSCFSIVSSVDGEFVTVDPSLYTVTVKDALNPSNYYTNISPNDVTVADNIAQTSGQINAQGVQAYDATTTNFAALRAPAGVPTLLSQDTATSTSQPLDVVVGELRLNGAPGTSGDVLVSGGTGAAPTWQAPTFANFGSKVLLCVEGGAYASLQAAVSAASANDVIMVGPKASGDWGNVTLNVVNKPLVIAALPGAGPNKVVSVGSITYDLGTGAALNANLNEVYIYGLYIQGSFPGGSAVTLTGGANRPGRLRLYGCYVLNTSATGAAAITNSNQGSGTSLYIDSCVVSLSNSAAGSAIVQTAGYTVIRNRCDVNGSIVVGSTGGAIEVSKGIIEIYDSYISIDRAGNTASTINIPAGSDATTFVSAGYSTITNNSDAANSACVNIGTAGATFGAGDATLASGASLAAAGAAVKGIAGGSFLYANVSFSYSTTVSTVTATATAQSGGLFVRGMSVGSVLAQTFAVNSSGNITKINNVTTSFPSAQGSANQVLTNNGSGTLTWTNGNLSTLGSVGATPTAANLRTNATYTVNVAAVALPAMAAGDDGLTISLVNISGAGSTVTPSTGVARTMSTGGGQTWVWRNTGTTWYCISNV